VTRIGFIGSFFVQIYWLLSFIPFLSFVVIWFASYLITSDKKKSTRFSIDITSILLIGAVASQMHKLFGSWFGFWLLLFILLLTTGLIGRKQNELRGAINIPRILKIMLRIGFVVLSFIYVVLLIIISLF
jgi:hypothetical protein